MDTLRLIKINNNQLYIELSSEITNFSKKITTNLKIDSIKSLSRKINHDILKEYIQKGSSIQQLKTLKESAFELFNILDFFKLEQYFNQIKRNKKNHYLRIIIDSELNAIPFELLHDGKDFLSDFLILSREFTDSNLSNENFCIDSNKKFSIVINPSESDDIDEDVINESNFISNMIEKKFILGGPFKNRNVDKVELIRLLGSSTLFHFSGHYEIGGWKLFNDRFQSDDILKCSRSSDFIFSNSCGNQSDKFISFINAFFERGTKTIISSIGELPSNKAKDFSKIFYKFFIDYRHSVGESLFLTKKQIIKKYGHQDLIWCYYQLYGSSLLSVNKNIKLGVKTSPILKIRKIIYIFSFLIIISFIIKNLFYEKDDQTEIEINVKSNVKVPEKYIFKPNSNFEINNEQYYPMLFKCDSIKNNYPFFSLLDKSDNLNIEQLIIDKNNNFLSAAYPLTFDKDSAILNIFLSDINLYDRFELIFDDDIDYSVFLQYNRPLKIFYLHIINIQSDLRYKIDLNDLIKIKSPIHKYFLKNYLDEFPYSFQRDSEFEIIKDSFNFKNRLILDIKKDL
ncbi:MAG: CHAT domain-containing protein [Candidatus Neomarinimicrobiota bacterium]